MDVTSRTDQPIGSLDPLDWTTSTLHRAAQLCALFVGAASTRAGRRALCVQWPGLRALDAQDRNEVITVVRAHRAIGRVTRCTAYVLDKRA
ncbi:hypothetical protein ACFQ7M_35105 [Streptomyces massasporeus]